MFKDFHIWWKHFHESDWRKTAHVVKARTDKEAQSKTRQKFKDCGFSGVTMVAVESGNIPNI